MLVNVKKVSNDVYLHNSVIEVMDIGVVSLFIFQSKYREQTIKGEYPLWIMIEIFPYEFVHT